MDNNDNHNGKEVPRDQTLRNGQKENSRQPVNRIKKNITGQEQETRPGEGKKIPLNANRQPGIQKKSTSKGHIIKLGDKENKINPVDTVPRENRRTYPKTTPANVANTSNAEAPVFNQVYENNNSRTSNERFSISDKTGQYLLIAAVVLFIAWAVLYFYYHIGGNSHMLLAFAVLCAVISLAGKRKK